MWVDSAVTWLLIAALMAATTGLWKAAMMAGSMVGGSVLAVVEPLLAGALPLTLLD